MTPYPAQPPSPGLLIPLRKPPHLPKGGFTLIATLLILSVLVILLIGAFSVSNTDLAASRTNFDDHRASLALDSAFQAATQTAFNKLATTEDFVVFRSQQTIGSSASYTRPVVYYTAVRVVDTSTNTTTWKYTPLISGARADIESPTLTRMPVTGQFKRALFPNTPAPNGDDSGKDAKDRIGNFPYLGPNAVGASGWSDLPVAAWKTLDFRPNGTRVASPGDPMSPPDLTANAEDQRAKGQDYRIRYCFWVEDLAGKIDGDIAGNMDGITPALEKDYTHVRGRPSLIKDQPRQLALFTLLPSAGVPGTNFPNIDAATGAGKNPFDFPSDNVLISKRQYVLTGDTASQLRMPAAEETMLKKAVYFGAPAWSEPTFMPRRSPIALNQRGKRALSLNKQIELAESDNTDLVGSPRDKAVETIAEHIKLCLPNFAQTRVGGNIKDTSLNAAYDSRKLSADEYVYSLAANIIDYADRDLTPTVNPDWKKSQVTTPVYKSGQAATRVVQYTEGDAKVPRYRGIDGQPFVCGYTTRYFYNNFSAGSASVQLSTWMSLWNPTDREIEGEVSARLTEGRTAATVGNQPVVPHMNLPKKQIILKPNEFNHVGWYNHTTLTINLGSSTAPAPSTIGIDDSPGYAWYQSGFQLFWNDKLADATRRPDNINRIHQRTASKGGWLYLSAGLGDSGTGLNDPALSAICDPRGGLYSAGRKKASEDNGSGLAGAYFREPSSYATHMFWGGGATKTSYNPPDRIQPSGWLGDPGHKFEEYTEYNNTPLESRTPDEEPKHSRPPSPNKAPAHIKHPEDDYPPGYTGPGYYESLGELGHIFDPNAWTNVAVNTINTNDELVASIQAGGRTLHIGTPEFKSFTKVGTKAVDLLDIFCLDEDRPMKGVVNINSVSPEVARVLVAGQKMEDDPGMLKSGTGDVYSPSANPNADAGGIFAAAVTGSTTATAPLFTSESELADLKVLGSPTANYFGSTENSWPAGQNPRPKKVAEMTGAAAQPSSMDDSGREEMFRKLLPLVTFKSRTFRMYLTAQVLDKNGNPVGTRSRVYNLFLRPVRDANGNIINQNVEVFYAKDL